MYIALLPFWPVEDFAELADGPPADVVKGGRVDVYLIVTSV
jgi:hypothetical protein